MKSFYSDLFSYVLKNNIEPNSVRLDGLKYILDRMRWVDQKELRKALEKGNIEEKPTLRNAVRSLRRASTVGYLIMGKEVFEEYRRNDTVNIEDTLDGLDLDIAIRNALERSCIKGVKYLLLVMSLDEKWYDGVRGLGTVRVKVLYSELLKKGYIDDNRYLQLSNVFS